VLDLTGTVWPALPPARPRLELLGAASRLDVVELLPEPATPPASDAAATAPASAATLVPVLPAVDARVTLHVREAVLHGSTLRDVELELQSNPTAAEIDIRAGALRAGDTTLYDAVAVLHAADRAGRGSVRAARATLHKLEATQLESDVQIAGQTIHLPAMRARAYGGTLRGTSALDLSIPTRPRYSIEAAADAVQFSAFLGAFVPIGNAITGALDMTSKWTFAGPGPASLRQTLNADGKALAKSGRIADLPVLRALAALLDLPSLAAIPYRDLGLDFAVDRGRLSMRDATIRAADADFGLGGSIGLDGSLDLAVEITLSPELSRRALGNRAAGVVSSLFADPSGRLVFDVAVGGTHRAPNLRLDVDKTARRAGASRLTENVLRRILGDKLPALPVPGVPAVRDSTALGAGDPAEALRRRAIDAAREQLGGKLGGLLGGSRPDSSAPRP
jgi:hypothetical protein